MAFKRQNKVSAEFSMSSLTDIIFLLLIFFMLTSTLVRLNPFPLPESDNKTVAATSLIVSIEKTGIHSINKVPFETEQLEYELKKIMDSNLNENFETVTIVAEKGTAFDHVLNVMQVANKLKLNAIVATEPKKS
jgi:biopolymer transport protein ExbD